MRADYSEKHDMSILQKTIQSCMKCIHAWIQLSARIDLPGSGVLPGYSFQGLPGKAVKGFATIDSSAWMPG